MNGFSIIIPVEAERLALLNKTMKKYSDLIATTVDFVAEIIFVSRSLRASDLAGGFVPLPNRLISYSYDSFYRGQVNPSLAFNLGVAAASYDNIIITSPEVTPISNVFNQIKMLDRENCICKTYDQNEDGSRGMVLVSSTYRQTTPAMYYFAVYKKEDILLLNGWDESFMGGLAYEDTDFGNRFVSAGLSFELRDNIEVLHQYHRMACVNGPGWAENKAVCDANYTGGIVGVERGISSHKVSHE